MIKLLPQSLRGRVIAVVLVTTFATLAVAMATLVAYDAQAYRQAITADLITEAEILGRTNAPALVFDDPQAARENLAVLHARPALVAAAIYRLNGELFASYIRPESPPPKPPDTHTGETVVIEGDEIRLARPIVEKDEVVGTVAISYRYDVRKRLESYLLILAAVMLASGCVAVLLSTYLQTRITDPILSMTDVVRQVMTDRNFSLRVSRTDTREINVLVDAFNEMMVEVGDRTEALAKSNQVLQAEMAVRTAAEHALTAANRNKDQFLATLAHELRNPLAPLANGLVLLKLPAQNSVESGKVLDMMGRQVRQMVRLIDDLLDVSRIATDKLVLRVAEIDLVDVIEAAVESVTPAMVERRHHLTMTGLDRPLPLRGDAIRLVQVVSNLLHNAAKFTPPEGHIGIALNRHPDSVDIIISDNGIGIAPDTTTRIFNLFEQADQSVERAQQGLGVGLTLARRLVVLHGGSLDVQSPGLGQGAEFTVVLPRARDPL